VFTRRAHVPLPTKIHIAARIGLRRIKNRLVALPPAGSGRATPGNASERTRTYVHTSLHE
jgi:hypothetical protein